MPLFFSVFWGITTWNALGGKSLGGDYLDGDPQSQNGPHRFA